MVATVASWLFTDRRTGRLVIAQRPNGRALLATAAWAARLVLAGRGRRTAGHLADVATVAWAADEVARGVNPFRRMLGVAAVLGVVAWRWR